MKTHVRDAVVGPDGSLTLQNLPFEPGDTVEVTITVLPRVDDSAEPPESLRGSVLEYHDPFEPAVPIEDWEVLR